MPSAVSCVDTGLVGSGAGAGVGHHAHAAERYDPTAVEPSSATGGHVEVEVKREQERLVALRQEELRMREKQQQLDRLQREQQEQQEQEDREKQERLRHMYEQVCMRPCVPAHRLMPACVCACCPQPNVRTDVLVFDTAAAAAEGAGGASRRGKCSQVTRKGGGGKTGA